MVYGSARRDLVLFQRGAGYSSGVDPFQQGGRKNTKRLAKGSNWHEIYCSKNLHSGKGPIKRKTRKGKKGKKKSKRNCVRNSSLDYQPAAVAAAMEEAAEPVINSMPIAALNARAASTSALRRSTRKRRAPQKAGGRRRYRRQRGGIAPLAAALIPMLPQLVGSLINGVAGQTGRGQRGGSFKNKLKGALDGMKKYGKKIAKNKEVKAMANTLLKKAVNAGVPMLASKAQKVKVLKQLVTPNMVNKLQSGLLKQVDKRTGVQSGSGILSGFLASLGL